MAFLIFTPSSVVDDLIDQECLVHGKHVFVGVVLHPCEHKIYEYLYHHVTAMSKP